MYYIVSLALVGGISLVLYTLYLKFSAKIITVYDEVQRIKRILRNLEHSALSDMQRLSTLENYARNLSERQDIVLARSSDGSYMHAGKMVEMGAAIDDIISACGLTRAEAELVVAMYGKK